MQGGYRFSSKSLGRTGKIEDVALDPASGATLELDLRDRGTVAGDRLVGLGACAFVVAEAVNAPRADVPTETSEPPADQGVS